MKLKIIIKNLKLQEKNLRGEEGNSRLQPLQEHGSDARPGRLQQNPSLLLQIYVKKNTGLKVP